MRNYYSLAAAAVLAFSALSASAEYTATLSLTPAPGEYETLPTSFTIKVEGEGLTSIKKNIAVGNPLKITSPSGQAQACPATWNLDAKELTCNIPATSTLPLDEAGEYTVAVQANSITYVWEDASTSKAVLTPFTYTVTGNGGGGGGDEKTEVAYDIQMTGTTPKLNPFDLEMKTFETIQFIFNMPNLQIAEDMKDEALVTITGPSYKETAQLRFNMAPATNTNFKALFTTEPKYNGTYTLTIPQGILGDADWIEDHQYGHANAAVNMEFEIVGGADPSTITKDLSFNPLVTPAVGSKVPELSKVSLMFDSKPYWNHEASISISYKEDLQGGAAAFCNATIEEGEGNELFLVFATTATAKGQYLVTLPEGLFWNEDHENNENGGKLNSALELNWYLVPQTVEVNVTSHVPATDAKVESFKVGEPGIIINTDNNAAVAKLGVDVVSYVMDDDSSMPKTIISTTSTSKTEDGAICWINTGENNIDLSSDCYYEVSYRLYDAANNVLVEDMFEFYGQTPENPEPPTPPTPVEVNVVSTVPEADTKLESLEQIVINTDNNEEVAKMDLTVKGYLIDEENAEGETIVTAVGCDKKNDEGAIYWQNMTDAVIELWSDRYYMVEYKLYDSENEALVEGSFKIYGNTTSGVELIEAEGTTVIFNVQGLRIDREASELPAGLYIINGKKSVVR